MQFLPSTWARYGVDANGDGHSDPDNPVDAIFAAARYLHAAGADRDPRAAIFAYNHADWYVDSVLMRARLIGGLPADLVGSLTGLAQGRMPVDGHVRFGGWAHRRHRGLYLYTRARQAVRATQDGRIARLGHTPRLGRFVQLRDVYGNTYTYARLGRIATRVPVPKARTQSSASIASELELPQPDPAPAQAASAGSQPSTPAGVCQVTPSWRSSAPAARSLSRTAVVL